MSKTPSIGGPPSQPVFSASTSDASRGLLVFVLLVVILYFGKEVLIPITLALMLSFLLAPLVTLLRKIRLGRILAVLLAVIMAIVVLIGIGSVIGSQIADLATELPQYAGQVETKVKGLEASTYGRLSHMVNKIRPAEESRAAKTTVAQNQGPPPSQSQIQSRNSSSGQSPGGAPAAAPFAQAPAPAAAPAATPRALIMHYLGPVLAPFATLGIVIVVTIFALLQREDLRDRMIRLIGSDDIHRTTLAMDDAGHRLSRYFLTQFAVNTFFGIVIGTGLYFIGVPKPVLWGVLSALLRFVPYVGSFISAFLPVVLAAAVEPGWSMALWTAAFFVVAEGITGQAIEPTLYGHSTGLSPFSVVVAAIFWSWLWGPIGLILSTPLTLCLVVMGRHVKRLEFLDVLLGDKPALTPVESFYQRVLADDPDEALDQAELYLKQDTLAGYYDKVVLKAMQMAAFDAERGVMIPHQLSAVVKTIEVLVSSLDDHSDEDTPAVPANADDADQQNDAPDKAPAGSATAPEAGQPAAPPSSPTEATSAPPAPTIAPINTSPSWAEPSAILNIAGRGMLDEPATAMLSQLLRRQKFGCREVPHGEVGRNTIRGLDTAGVKLACLAYLDVSSSQTQLRHLVRRLRLILPPKTPILVGLWPIEDEALHDDTNRATIGADHYASSFEDVLDICRTLSKHETPPETPALEKQEAA